MKKLFFALVSVMVLLLASCQQATSGDAKGLYIYNSRWERQYDIEKQYARDIVAYTPEEYAAKYNETTPGDHLYIYDKEVPISEAPLATAFICQIGDHKLLMALEGVPRSDFIDRAETWKLQAYAMAGELYIDHCPVYTPIIDNRTDYEKYAVYMILKTDGSIYFETHCQDWKEAGYASIGACYEAYLLMVNNTNYADGGIYTIVIGQIYTVPVPEEPKPTE